MQRQQGRLIGLALVLAASLLAAPYATAQSADPPSPEAVIAAWPATHPLIGKIVRLADGQVTDGRAVPPRGAAGGGIVAVLGLDEASGPIVAVLGEVHDNPEHHLLRAGVILEFWPPVPIVGRLLLGKVVMEHVAADEAAVLADLSAAPIPEGRAQVDALMGRLRWTREPDGTGRRIRPMLLAALAVGEVLPGEPPRDTLRRVAREGLAPALDAAERTRLGLDAPLDKGAEAALSDELIASHCGLLPASAVPRMITAQRYRDGHMARAAADAMARKGSTIVLTGNGHVRRDRGVPWHLAKIAPGVKTIAVLLLEVEDGVTDPAAYPVRAVDGTPLADFVIFTPRTARPDPCEEMRKSFKK